jgi:hypothetical protein
MINEIRNEVVTALRTKQSPEAQRALSRFVALLDELDSSQKSNFDLDKQSNSSGAPNTQALLEYGGNKPALSQENMPHTNNQRIYETRLRSILSSLTSADPNVNFADRTISNVENDLMRHSGGWITQIIYKMTDGSPIVAVYMALFLSLILWILLLIIFEIFEYLEYPLVPTFISNVSTEFFVTVTFAFFGALVSIAFRLDFEETERVGIMPLFLTNLFKPYIGSIFGIVVFCLLESRIVQIPGVNVTNVGIASYGKIEAIRAYPFLFICAVVGFASGFSERFATDLIDRSSGVFVQSPRVPRRT